jgi:hypothetical protein
MCLFLSVASDNVACRGRSSSILQQLLQKSLAATFMVAEEIEDAEFADQRILKPLSVHRVCYRGGFVGKVSRATDGIACEWSL